jgi:NADH:ubiquinone oxidoreductase subunit 5 (subunit L)/multisubunit Na+/H+ antiporter MnhA subunit
VKRPHSNFLTAALAIIGTVVGIGFVVVASERRAPRNQTGEGVPGLLKNLGVAVAIVYVAVAAYVVFIAAFSGQRRARERSASKPLTGLIMFVLAVMMLTFVASKFRRIDLRSLPRPRAILPSNQGTAFPNRGAQKAVTWGFQLGFLLVVLLVVVTVTLTVRSRRSRVVPVARADRRALVAVSLDDLLLELDHELDPRRAVLLADHGMEMALGEHGMPRSATETAQEHVQRVAAELSLSNTAARTLTMLYGQAHFSENEMTSVDRVSAIAALQSVSDELRAKPPTKAAV